MRTAIVLLLIAAGLYAVHRLFCWFESRGWMYWTHSSGAATRAGNAMLEVQSLLEPEKKYVIEMKQDQKAQRDHAGDGDPDPTGASPGSSASEEQPGPAWPVSAPEGSQDESRRSP